MQKQWYSFALWGRLSYEPDLPNALFQRMLAARFPGAPTTECVEAIAAAWKTFPQVTRFFWRDLDFNGSPKATSKADMALASSPSPISSRARLCPGAAF